ncbi:MAG TPA: PAS domain S-box protein [Geobacteraceae bacterium]|nr:PAS domain S-box protein [Geobacteraceae bacterium]
MDIISKVKAVADNLAGEGEIRRLAAENEALRERERKAVHYIRRKIDQLLMVMGTLPLNPEELDDATLLEVDPIGIISDAFAQIQEHLRATNEKLKLAHDEIQAILRATGVGILVVDNAMKIQAYNQRLKELFSPDEKEIMGKRCFNILCKQQELPAACTFRKVLATKVGVYQAGWIYNDRHFDVAGAPIKNRFGDITHVVLAYNDITDRKRTEDALWESMTMYRELLERANDLVQSVAPDGSFRFANRAWLEALGYSREDLVRLSLPDVIHPDSRHHCQEFFKELLAGRWSGRIETSFVTKDGKTIRVWGDVSCIMRGGEPVATCGIFRKADESR